MLYSPPECFGRPEKHSGISEESAGDGGLLWNTAAKCGGKESSDEADFRIFPAHGNHSREADVISNVTSPWMWMLLLGITVSLAAVIYWGFFGTLVDSVSGTGVVVRTQGISAVTAKSSGTIEYLDIKPGSFLVPNQILGRIYDPVVFFTIHKLRVEQKELEERTAKIQSGTDALFLKRQESDRKRNELIENLVRLMEENRGRLRELVSMQKELRDIGIASKVDYYNILSQSVNNENSVADTLITQLQDLYEQDESIWQQEENHIKLQGELFAKQQEVELALKSNQDLTWLRSDSRGVVLELLKHTGDPVTAGETIAIVSAGGNHQRNIRLIAYVSAADGKKVRPGMSVYFSPSALRAADYGYIRGVVASVSLFPVSCDSISAELKNRDFAGTITQGGGRNARGGRFPAERSDPERVAVDQPERHGGHRGDRDGRVAAHQYGISSADLLYSAVSAGAPLRDR